MAGLLDLYGGALTPDQTQALQQRGLLGFLGGMQKSGALDYTAPFLSGKVPGGFAAALAGGAGGMGEAQDAGALNAMRGQLLGLQGQELKGKLGLLGSEADLMRAIAARNAAGQGGAPNTAGPSTAAPGDATAPTGGLLPTLVKGAESEGLAKQLGISPYDIGFGGADLSKAPKDDNGFPVWEGKQGPAGISHAAGAYQFQPATWAEYAGPLGIKDFSPASQDKVFQAAVADKGLQPWMANPKIAALVRTGQFGGSGSSMPPQPAPQGLLPQPAANAAAAPAGGLLAQAASGQPPQPASPAPQPSLAAPAGMSFGGGINMSPAEAQQLSLLQAMRGAATPDFINKTAGMPLVGPTATAKAEAENASKLRYAGPIAQAEDRAKIKEARQGGTGWAYNPATGKWELQFQSPQLPMGTTLGIGPNGQEYAQKVPGSDEALASAEAAKERGKNQTNLGPLAGPQAGQPAPGQSQPLSGTPLAKNLTSTNPDYQEPQFSPAELHSRIPEWTKTSREITSQIGMAQQAEHRLSNIADAFKLVEPSQFATHKAEIAAAFKDLGIPYPQKWDPANVQLALHENYRATLQNLAAVNKRFSQMEFKVTSEQSEHPNIQPSANLEMLSEDIGALRQMQGMGHDWLTAQQAGKHNPDAFETAWLKANPLGKISDAVKQEIGPLKGMQNTPAPQGAVNYLKFNPNTRDQFDAKYGAGSSATILGR